MVHLPALAGQEGHDSLDLGHPDNRALDLSLPPELLEFLQRVQDGRNGSDATRDSCHTCAIAGTSSGVARRSAKASTVLAPR